MLYDSDDANLRITSMETGFQPQPPIWGLWRQKQVFQTASHRIALDAITHPCLRNLLHVFQAGKSNLHSTEYCGMQLFMTAWDACFWHQSPHLYFAILINGSYYALCYGLDASYRSFNDRIRSYITGWKHFEAKWPPLWEWHFNAICFDLVKTPLKFVSKVPINNRPTSVQIMAWLQTGTKP